MIKHYNIPIFLPELACPYRCVYCNQFSITGLNDIVKAEDVKTIIDSHLSSFKEENRFVEVAFFGGNFTGLPVGMQNDYLEAVQPYLDKGLIHGIRCSTRPDYITLQRVQEIKKLGMRNIELGAQSTNDEILRQCKRGHTYNDIVEASQTILSEGITLGLQMMIGLPSSSEEHDLQTARDIVNLGAKETRIYPCIVVKDTELATMYQSGDYQALSIEEAVRRSSKLYTYFIDNQVKVLRIGLHASDELDSEAYVAGPYHKNFAEMVFSNIWKEKLRCLDAEMLRSKDIIINVPESQINHAIGWRGENKKLLSERFDVHFNPIAVGDQLSAISCQGCLSLSKAQIGASTSSATEKPKAHSSQLTALYIDPKQIKLEGHDNGFFPGCCGVWKNNLIVCGSTKYLKEKAELDKFLKDNDFNLIELYDGELVDVGSVFFN